MRDIDEIFSALARSTFRAKFALRGRELAMLNKKGVEAIMRDAGTFIGERLAPAVIPNDGKQTPMRNHPVFVAQHATATCCRGCLEKWHHIPRGRALNDHEITHVLAVIRRWIESQSPSGATDRVTEVTPPLSGVATSVATSSNSNQLTLF